MLRYKGTSLSEDEEEGLLCAILLHDIGHGPFSHAMENGIVAGTDHEQLSLFFMEELNRKFNGSLTMALEIFKGEHPKKFLNQLVSSQLDMDRLDYLKRDSFYTGVAEGNINSERLITMLNVVKGELVVEEKGIYSVEKFLMARRFMYWQAYLHKTSLVAEQLLIRILMRARFLLAENKELPCSENLKFFLCTKIEAKNFNPEYLERFAKLDDVDVLAAIKTWQYDTDFILSHLCQMIVNRQLPHIKIKDKPINKGKKEALIQEIRTRFSISKEDAGYFVFDGTVENRAYNKDKQNINILRKNGKLVDVAKASDHLNLMTLSNLVVKHYLCYPRENL